MTIETSERRPPMLRDWSDMGTNNNNNNNKLLYQRERGNEEEEG
jgi:hypothetical protein